ncbi:hypothetical protein D7V83_18700 [bacterium 0.1xD8-71]|nr:hypothetical protein D7V83_18700 [bacterium 0.1xD8-71]
MVLGRYHAAKYEKRVDFQSGDVIMIEKPYTLGKRTECSQNVHIMFVECSDGFGYIIGKESYGFLKIVKCSENMTA